MPKKQETANNMLKKSQIKSRILLDKRMPYFHEGLWLLVNHNILKKWLKLYQNQINATCPVQSADFGGFTRKYSLTVPKKFIIESQLKRVKVPDVLQNSIDSCCINLYLFCNKELHLYEPNNNLSQKIARYMESLYKPQNR